MILFRKIWFNILIGGILFVTAVFLDAKVSRDAGSVFVFLSVLYPVLSIIFLKLPSVKILLSEKDKLRAQNELIRFKNLYDQGIISKEEYESKSVDLKKKIL